MIDDKLFEKHNFTFSYQDQILNNYYQIKFLKYQQKLDSILFSILFLNFIYGITFNYISFSNLVFFIPNLFFIIFSIPIFVFLIKNKGNFIFKSILRYLLIIFFYSLIIYEIIHLNIYISDSTKFIKILKSCYRLILISSITICFLIEMNLISMLVSGTINTAILLIIQIGFSNDNLIFIDEILGNILIFLTFGFIRSLFEYHFKFYFEKKIKNNFINSNSKSILQDINIGFLSISNNQLIFCNDFFINIINPICNSFQDDGKIKINKLLDTEQKLINEELNHIRGKIHIYSVEEKQQESNNQQNKLSNLIEFMKKMKLNSNSSQTSLYSIYEKKIHSLSEINIPNKSIFNSLGKFFYENEFNKINLEVYIRITSCFSNHNIIELLAYDLNLEYKINYLQNQSKFRHQILANFAHEFKTPILSIISLTDNIKESSLKQIMSNCKKLKSLSSYTLTLITNLIQYSKNINENPLNPQQTSAKNQEFSINELLKFCFEIMICLINLSSNKENFIKPILEIENNLNGKFIYSDEIKLKQIILNLISNAIKFTKSGTVKLGINTTEDHDLMIYVEDTGIGINITDHINLFNENSIINNKEIDNNLGSGLGLSISQFFAKQLNTKIEFKTENGSGSIFYLILKNSLREKIKNKTKNTTFSNSNNSNHSKFSKSRSNESLINNFERIINDENIFSDENLDDRISDQKYESEINDLNIKIHSNKNIMQNNLRIKKLKEFNKNLVPRRKDKSYKLVNLYVEKYLSQPYFNVFSQSDLSSIKTHNNLNSSIKTHKNPNLPIAINISRDTIDQNKITPKIYNKNLVSQQILIVDDCKYVLNSLSKIIKDVLRENSSEINVLQMNDGVETLKYVYDNKSNNSSIILIISDENMEFINGSDTFIILKKLEKSYKIKPIKLAIISSDINNEYYEKIGIDKIIDKKYDKNIFRNLLRDLQII